MSDIEWSTFVCKRRKPWINSSKINKYDYLSKLKSINIELTVPSFMFVISDSSNSLSSSVNSSFSSEIYALVFEQSLSVSMSPLSSLLSQSFLSRLCLSLFLS